MTKCLKGVEGKETSRPPSLIKKDDASLSPEKNDLDDKSFLSAYSSLSPDPFYWSNCKLRGSLLNPYCVRINIPLAARTQCCLYSICLQLRPWQRKCCFALHFHSSGQSAVIVNLVLHDAPQSLQPLFLGYDPYEMVLSREMDSKIIEWFRLEGALKIISFQFPCNG